MAQRYFQAALVVAASTVLVLVGVLITPVQAYNTYNGHHLVYGVSGQKYWLSSGAANNYNHAINTGVGLWDNASGVPVSYSRTYTKSASRLDFYRTADSNNNDEFCATTSWFVGKTKIGGRNIGEPGKNWTWAKVHVNRLTFKDSTSCTESARRKTMIAHEMGHGIGLKHVFNNQYPLMYWALTITNTNGPRQDDRNGINALY